MEAEDSGCLSRKGKLQMTPLKTFDGQLLLGLVPGTWAAISSDQEKVAGTGATVEEALAAARESGEDKPFLIRVPSENSSLIV
jgi:hypothetical protein